MAERQIAARIEGDVYQGMFFWYQAAALSVDSSKVSHVELEHDEAAGVDDVAVFYEDPGITDAGRLCSADFYQLKYHVDQSYAYSSQALIDPDFIHSKRSLLHRFFRAYEKLRGRHKWFRLQLISNWQWRSDDKLACSIRERDGALPDRFFTDGEGSEFGKIHTSWQTHLGVDRETFDDFARRLRFGLNYFGRFGFKEMVCDRLASIGLRRIPADCESSPYDSLAQQFVMNGNTRFDRTSFLSMCCREGLVEKRQPAKSKTIVGIRSFMRFAERMEDETSRFVCVADSFEGRHIRNPALWNAVILPTIRGFLSDPLFRKEEHHLLLECHGSLAFLTGYELDRSSGALAYPVQKGHITQVWKPSEILPEPDWGWECECVENDENSNEVVVAISITYNVLRDVERFLCARKLRPRMRVHMLPLGGCGTSSISGADHAAHLADFVTAQIRTLRADGITGRVHIFFAAPNAFMFYLGRHRKALGKVQLYEFDFEVERDGSYSPSLFLPN